MNSKMTAQKIQLENLVETLWDSFKPGNSFEITFFEICRKFEGFCLIWEVFTRSKAAMADYRSVKGRMNL